MNTMLEYDEAYKSDIKLPVVLQLYFLHVSKQSEIPKCPKCGGLAVCDCKDRQNWQIDEHYEASRC